jgi:acetyl esterase/lipase
MFNTLWYVFQPSIDALTAPGLPFTYRWRLLVLQPITLLTYTIIKLPYLFSSPFSTIYIPNRHAQTLRTLVYLPKRRKEGQLSPLHLSFHAGAFIGGFPETQFSFNKLLPEKTGAVVIAPHYRVAPRHHFPAAIDDADDILKYCLENAERLWGADPKLLTVDGFSAGGNLALALCQQSRCHAPMETSVKASVTFYAPVSEGHCCP